MDVRREKRIAATSDIGPYGCVASSGDGRPQGSLLRKRSKGCVGEGKSAKRRQWRMKQAGFEEVPRLAGTTVPGNRSAQRWAREPRPYEGFTDRIS